MSSKTISIIFTIALVGGGCGVVGEIGYSESINTGDRSAGMERGKMSASQCTDRQGYTCRPDNARNVCECTKVSGYTGGGCPQLSQFDCEPRIDAYSSFPRCSCTRPLENRGAPGVHCWSDSDCASGRCRMTASCYRIGSQLFVKRKTCTAGGGTSGILPAQASASICPNQQKPHGSACYGDDIECTTGKCAAKCFTLKGDSRVYKLGACIHGWEQAAFSVQTFLYGTQAVMHIPDFDREVSCPGTYINYTGNNGSSNNSSNSSNNNNSNGTKSTGPCTANSQCTSGYCGCLKDQQAPSYRRICLGNAPATRGYEYWTGSAGANCTSTSRKGLNKSCTEDKNCMSGQCGRATCGGPRVCIQSDIDSAPDTCPSTGSGSNGSGLSYYSECSSDSACASGACGCSKNEITPARKKRCLIAASSSSWSGAAAFRCTSIQRKGVGQSCVYEGDCLSQNCGREQCGGPKVCLRADHQSAAATCPSSGSSNGGSSTTCSSSQCPTSVSKATTTAGTFAVDGCASQGVARVGFDNKCYVCGSGQFDGWTLVSSNAHTASSCAQLVSGQGGGGSGSGGGGSSSSSGGSGSGGTVSSGVTCPPGFSTSNPVPQTGTPIFLGFNVAGSTPCNYGCWGSGYGYNVCTTTGGGVGWQFCLPSGVFASCAAR
ncbi:MAG: hypothetical protein KC503_04570 [Myxococcales bacterium]|nr:hypothetical protein [Myxococcales bacterium]